jgi:predicted RecB family nuclease
MKFHLFVLWVMFLVSTGSEASKPRLSRDGKTCEEILSGIEFRNNKASLANNTFVPLSVLISSNKCKMVAKNWREGPYHSKTLPTPGLLEMFRTADEASADVILKLGLKGIESPVYDKRSPLEGAAATLEMMERVQAPQYIRNGVLFREGVFTVVPLLILLEAASKKTNGKNIYVPLVAKGHQDLSQNDIYTAVFTAWALEPWIGRTPDHAYIHLVPMAVKRKAKGQQQEPESTFAINPKQYFPIIREVYEDFMATVSDPKRLEGVEPRRCTECNRCPWAAYCRNIMKQSHDLSMMPLPPTAAQVEVFANHGFGDMTKLARLDINSPAFIDLSLRSGLSSSRLRYMVAHAKSTVSGKPLVTRSFADPFKDKLVAAHIDFEDLMDPKIRSGVYLFGVETQNLKSEISEAIKKEFFFAKELTQVGVDDAWASFLRFLKKDQDFSRDDWVVTMYSKHEVVKFEQQFDIVRAPASEFSAAERRSEFYSEFGDPKKPIGRLIRRKEFFEQYPDLHPSDIFNVIDRSIDLLEYTRHALAFPTYSNSIKQILKYVRTEREPIEYPEGANGLESMAQAREGFTRQEEAFFEWARAYNEIDIDVNRLVADFVRANADLPMAKQLRWTSSMEELRKDLDKSVLKKNALVQLLKRKSLFEKATKRSLRTWKDSEFAELMEILDRSEYLASRTEISDLPKIDPRLKSAKLQKLRFEFTAGRQSKLYNFLLKANPKLGEELKNGDAHRAFVDLLQFPAHLLSPTHLKQMIVLTEMQRDYAKLKIAYAKNPIDRLEPPEGFMESLDLSGSLADLAAELEVSKAELKFMWHGLYLVNAFGK